MEARVKISKFTQEQKSLLINFIRQSFAANVFGSEPVSNHNIALFTFNYQEWLNQWQNIIKHWSSCLPVVNWSSKFLFTSPSISGVFGTTKCIFQPDYKRFIAACNFKHRVPLITCAIFSLFGMTNVDAAFSIYKASQISNFSNCVSSFKVDNFSHKYPFINYYIVTNEKVYAERLNGWDSYLQGYAKV